MKAVIVREVSGLVLRPSNTASASTSNDKKEKKSTSATAHARYYATITFNQIVLYQGDGEVARGLVELYFEMFRELLGMSGAADEGAGEEEEKGDEEPRKDKAGRVVVRSKGKEKKGKGKEKQEGEGGAFTEVEDAQSKLVSAILTGVNRALPFVRGEGGELGWVISNSPRMYH